MSEVFNFNVVKDWFIILVMFSFMAAVGNWVGYHYPFQNSLIGMFILCGISFVGLILEKVIPYDIPSILYISLIALFLSLPWSPVAEPIVYYTKSVDIVSLTTILLAYAGIAMGKDLKEFKNIGAKGILVTFFVITGTYIGSAVIAHIVLSSSGMI